MTADGGRLFKASSDSYAFNCVFLATNNLELGTVLKKGR